jgi:hypothetical protein
MVTTVNSAEFEVCGWGHGVKGGEGGEIVIVNRLDDDVKMPLPGMLRWALLQKGARIVRFEIEGDLWLKDRIQVRHGQLSLDGSTSPGRGICIRGGAIEFAGCEEIVLRHFRVRLGDEQILRKLKSEQKKRPSLSTGLDCISFHECRGVVLDHLSLAWSCDELLAVVRCQRVTVQWCLLSEPLGNPKIHPYGNNHAYGILCSASTLTIHHSVLVHYWMRGPQFEANDIRKGDPWNVRMEAFSNVFADFGRSGSRYTTGVEDHQKDARGRRFQFQFAGNVYLDTGKIGRSIEAVTKHGVHSGVQVWLYGNWIREATGSFSQVASSIRLDSDISIAEALPNIRCQLSSERLFTSPNSPSLDLGGDGLSRLLSDVGSGPIRDSIDQRVVNNVLRGKTRPVLRSQKDL